MAVNAEFWQDRRVLLTGHTGFKGAWLALWLESLGARVSAIALESSTAPSLFGALAPWPELVATVGDLRDPQVARTAVSTAKPEIVVHLAAQALVRPSYSDPLDTFASNVLGTVHLLDAVRDAPSVAAVLVVTSDKVYANDGRGKPFREDDPLGGRDPYSASKACQEIVTHSYRQSFFRAERPRIATARAGNVIGGGDWAADRLVPDFVRAVGSGRPVAIRHPDATRPWQHVLDSLAGYLLYAERLCSGLDVPAALNFGPRPDDVREVRWVADRVSTRWNGLVTWKKDSGETVPEAPALTLDASLATDTLGWRPQLDLKTAIDWTVDWYQANQRGADMRRHSLDDIRRYQAGLSD